MTRFYLKKISNYRISYLKRFRNKSPPPFLPFINQRRFPSRLSIPMFIGTPCILNLKVVQTTLSFFSEYITKILNAFMRKTVQNLSDHNFASVFEINRSRNIIWFYE